MNNCNCYLKKKNNFPSIWAIQFSDVFILQNDRYGTESSLCFKKSNYLPESLSNLNRV